MKTTIKTKTFPKSDKKNKDGNAPIYIRFTVNQTETSFSTGYFVDETRWKSTLHFKNTRTKAEQDIRKDIDDTLAKLQVIVDQFEKDGETFNAQMVKNRLFKKDKTSVNKNISFIQCFEAHKEKFIKDCITERVIEGQTPDEAKKNATLCHNKYNSMKEKLVDYLKQEYKVQDMPMKKFDDTIQQDFLLYLKGKLSKNTAQRYFISFNAIFYFSQKKKLITEYPFKDDFKIKYDRSTTASLTVDELKTLMTKEFSTERLTVVRDIFVLLCVTGYSFIDYFKLKRSDLQKRKKRTFIIWDRIKTDVEQNVPLIPAALDLISKYDNHPDCIATDSLMPLRSNTKLNEYLKEIGTLCEIKKPLTTRVSRKTFGSILKSSGVHLLDIKTLSGHSDSKTTEMFYVDIEDDSLVESMDKFDNKLKVA